MSLGPCLCGDPCCSRCFGASAAYDPPEECPVCGAPNHDAETGTMFDEETDTCGAAECKAKETAKREEWARQEAAADRAEWEAAQQWERENRPGAGVIPGAMGATEDAT